LNHFDEMACLLYLEGQLDDARSRELAAHAAECPACRDLLRALEHETNLLSAALTEENEPIPARLLGEQARSVPSWVWTLAFGAFAAGAYWVWTDGLGPWLNQLSNAGFGGTDLFSMVVFSGAFWEGWSDMIDAIQIGALILAGIAALGWLRRRLRRSAAISVVIPALLFALTLPQSAAAADVRRGQAIFVPAGETVHNDLVATGASVRIDGTVEGDVIAFTRSLNVTGHVTGDVIGFAEEALIGGKVDGNVRVVARNATLLGNVSKNVSTIDRAITLAPNGKVDGGFIAVAGSADLDGKIQRDLLGILGEGDLEGFIGGQSWIRGGRLKVQSTADIRGPATFRGPQQPEVEPGAKLASPMQTEIVEGIRQRRRSGARLVFRALFRYGAALLVGILFLLVLPGFFRATLRETGAIGLPIGIGALALITGAFLIVLCILLLLIGVGAGVAGVMAYAPILYVAQVFVGTWIGNRILGEPAAAAGAMIGRMALGLLILHVAGLIPVLGALMWLAVMLWGTGAVLMAFYRMSRAESTPVAPLPA
jgi:cytoskeletal protein CcmA (bactofilin family)